MGYTYLLMPARFDFHTHTSFTDGSGSVAAMVEAAEARGLEAVAITDHGPELSVGINPAKIAPMLEDIRNAREEAQIPVLAGMEVNILAGGRMDLNESVPGPLDLVVAGLHTLPSPAGSPEEQAREYFNVLMDVLHRPRFDVLAHPFQFYKYLAIHLPREEIEALILELAGKGVAVEINSKYRVPDDFLIQACLREGVKLSIGTDAHSVAELGRIDWPLTMLRRAGARREDLILERFL